MLRNRTCAYPDTRELLCSEQLDHGLHAVMRTGTALGSYPDGTFGNVDVIVNDNDVLGLDLLKFADLNQTLT